MRSKLIYIAMEENKEEKEFMKNVLIKNYPGYEIREITSNSDPISLLNSDFFLFVMTGDWIKQKFEVEKTQNLKDWVKQYLEKMNQKSFSGTVFILDKNSSQSDEKISPSCWIFRDIFDFKFDVLKAKTDIYVQSEIHQELKDEGVKEEEEKEKQKENFIPVPSTEVVQKKKEAVQKKNTQLSKCISPPESDIEYDPMSNYEMNFCKPVILEDYPDTIKEEKVFEDKYVRAYEILKLNYLYDKSMINKKVAFWSPLHTSDTVFHILFNFAIYLAYHDISVGVLEPISKYPSPLLYLTLSQFCKKPKDWIHPMEPYFSEGDFNPSNAKWRYKNVDWHPLNNKILNKKWTSDDIAIYMEFISNCNVGLVILPEGRMDTYTKETLALLHEIWIFVDNRQHFHQWIQFIKEIENNYPTLQIKLVHFDVIEEKHAKQIEEKTGYSVVSLIPPIHYEILKSQTMSKLLIEMKTAREKLEPAFQKMYDSLQLHSEQSLKKSQKMTTWHNLIPALLKNKIIKN